MIKTLFALFTIFLFNSSHSLTVIVTNYGNFKDINDGFEKVIGVKSLGGIYHIDMPDFVKINDDEWINLSKSTKIIKSNVTPLRAFEYVSAQKYLNGCYIYYEADSETHIRLNNSGDLKIKRASISGGVIKEESIIGKLKAYRNVVVLVDNENEVILSSEVNRKDNKLLVFNDPKFNEWEIQYVVKDCISGDWIYPKK